ncbi:MAG TPA: extracellular solute-binding protein, partial [Microlunatus sp.]|nr:extracellular solute-binding protein [Microlunatus sp.]
VAFQMFPFAESLEQPSVSPDGLTSDGYLNSAKWKQVGRFWHDVNNKDEIHPKGLTTDETLPFFQAGNAALFVAGAQYQDQLGPMSEQGEMDLDVAPHPYFEGGRRVNTSGSWAMGIGRNSEKQDAATEFIRFYTGPEGSKLWTKITGRPATFAAREDQLNNPENRKFPAATKLLAVYESDRFGVSRPKTVGYLELEAVVTSTCADIRNGADPDKALENAVTVLDRQLEKYRRR